MLFLVLFMPRILIAALPCRQVCSSSSEVSLASRLLFVRDVSSAVHRAPGYLIRPRSHSDPLNATDTDTATATSSPPISTSPSPLTPHCIQLRYVLLSSPHVDPSQSASSEPQNGSRFNCLFEVRASRLRLVFLNRFVREVSSEQLLCHFGFHKQRVILSVIHELRECTCVQMTEYFSALTTGSPVSGQQRKGSLEDTQPVARLQLSVIATDMAFVVPERSTGVERYLPSVASV